MAYGTVPEMNEPVEQYAECNGASVGREPKFRRLITEAYGITSVIEHLKELHAILGVSYDEKPCPEKPKSSSEPTLVMMLDELPEELAMAHSKIHDMINVTIEQLN